MNKILDMRQKRAEAWDAAKKFLNEHQDANGNMTAEDSATYERMEADIVNLGKNIDREERAAAMDAEMAKPTSSPVASAPFRFNGSDSKIARDSAEYKAAFWNYARKGRNAVTDALQVGTDSEGGYLVPDEFERTLIQALSDENVLRPLCHVIQTTSGDRKIPIVSSHGAAAWLDEEGQYSEGDEVFGQVTLGAHKLGTIIKVSEELMNDSAFDMQSYIANEFARRTGAKEEEAMFTGNGTGKPTGLLNATYGATTGVTAASATAFTADEVIDLYHALRGVYRKNAVWMMKDSTVKALRKLKDGNSQYLWQPGLREGQPDTLLGRPIVTTDNMEAVATAKRPILFGDFSYYWIADRQVRTFQRLDELYAANGQIGFRAYERVDGKLTLREAVQCMLMA